MGRSGYNARALQAMPSPAEAVDVEIVVQRAAAELAWLTTVRGD